MARLPPCERRENWLVAVVRLVVPGRRVTPLPGRQQGFDRRRSASEPSRQPRRRAAPVLFGAASVVTVGASAASRHSSPLSSPTGEPIRSSRRSRRRAEPSDWTCSGRFHGPGRVRSRVPWTYGGAAERGSGGTSLATAGLSGVRGASAASVRGEGRQGGPWIWPSSGCGWGGVFRPAHRDPQRQADGRLERVATCRLGSRLA